MYWTSAAICCVPLSSMHGHEVDTQGDGFFVVFVRASEALLATVAGQRALAPIPGPKVCSASAHGSAYR